MLELLGPENWTQNIASALAAALASLVECVEALTIILAVGVTRGWRSALLGAGTGFFVLFTLVLIFGPLLAHAPINVGLLQFMLGMLLLLFGTRWLRKAILRAAGVIPLHDEALLYEKEIRELNRGGAWKGSWNFLSLTTCFKAVMIEGVEVVFIVLALGASQASLVPVSLGAASALLFVVALGFALHRPLTRVPENALKFGVGVILSSFGIFWTGKGLGLEWPGGDLIIIGFITGFAGLGLLSAAYIRHMNRK